MCVCVCVCVRARVRVYVFVNKTVIENFSWPWDPDVRILAILAAIPLLVFTDMASPEVISSFFMFVCDYFKGFSLAEDPVQFFRLFQDELDELMNSKRYVPALFLTDSPDTK